MTFALRLLIVGTIEYATLFWVASPWIASAKLISLPRHTFAAWAACVGLWIVCAILRGTFRSDAYNVRWISHRFAVMLCMTGLLLVAGASLSIVRDNAETQVGLVMLLCTAVLGTVLFRLSVVALQRHGTGLPHPRLSGPTATEAMAQDVRPPVVYLRSFDKEAYSNSVEARWSRYLLRRKYADGVYLYSGVANPLTMSRLVRKWGDRQESAMLRLIAKLVAWGIRWSASGRDPFRYMMNEQLLFAGLLRQIGPYISLGRKSEKFERQAFGAFTDTVSEADWRDVVLRWIDQAAIVVIEAYDSDALKWELEQVVHRVSPAKVLVILPHEDEEYDRIKMRVAECLPVSLPDHRPSGRLLMFDDKWTPCPLKNSDANLRKTLAPFFRRNGINIRRGDRLRQLRRELQEELS